MTIFDEFAGSWRGTNGFRLMPDDALSTAPSSGRLTAAAGGYVAALVYDWVHPDDGAQDGLLLIGLGSQDPGDPSLIAWWADSWHQKPQPMTLTGARGGLLMELVAEYGGGWGWRITLDRRDRALVVMRMENVVPAEVMAARGGEAAPFPYTAMLAEWRA